MSWDAELSALTERIAGPLFTRPEPRQSFADLVRALLADVPRKNSWQLADHVGHRKAYRLEWLLNGAKWDADTLRDEVRTYVVEHLGRPDGVLIADDTQAIKKGDKSVGVAPQYCGASGQVENCQVMPMLTYASAVGHAFINRRLYLPERWADEAGRRKEAGVPEQVGFRTKPHQVIDMLTEELAAGTPFRYFAADSGYGRDPGLRAFCHEQEIAYVMAVPVDLPLIAVRGGGEPLGHVLDRLLACGTPALWERRSCADGTKGRRFYDWAAVAVSVKDQLPAPGLAHTVLIRRSISDPGEMEFFLAHAPTGTAVTELINAAGMRWKIEENNEQGKDLLGLTQYQVRKWTPWHRHVTTAMLAPAFLAVTRARLPDDTAADATAACAIDQPNDWGKDHPPREKTS
ncbi:SRSO17 transposase [Streptosporangium album]|uniref:SRSO17 transposase n=1 Tax=Streptosporangium album TaxID=47479 RepID=A0A7W7RRZ6_9ACTN|nr:IS701 family transposase [Streptosporangium album]MBB4937098.1 SRSO17 transposase [Streptosporangium album]